MDIMVLKVKSIIITLLFLFVAYKPAHATIYFYFDAEDGTVGNPVPNPPICTEQCGTYGVQPTYQSSGGAPQGSMYFEWQTYDNQPSNYTEIHNTQGLPITNIIGKTYYLAYFFNFTRINGLDIWHETGQSGDKGLELVGSGLRWGIGGGHWPSHANNQDHRYTMMIGNATYHLNPELEVADGYVQNQSGYNGNNPLQFQYEQWCSAVFAIKMTTDNTGSVTLYIDSMKLYEYNNIKTIATTSATITDIREGGTIAQSAYDAPAHYRKFDALMLTDNWQDIVDRGYLSSDTPPPSDGGNTPPPSSSSTGGDSSTSGGSGCGFVKDDSKGQGGKGEGVSLMIMLIIALAGIAIVKKAATFKRSKGVEHIKRMTYFLLFFFVILCIPVFANAADYYVATNGSDSNPGTITQPWQHIAFATCGGSYNCPVTTNNPNKLKAGDTLYIRGGTYLENQIQFSNSGTSGNPITITAYLGEKPIIDGGFTTGTTQIIPVFDIGALSGQGSHYIILDGLSITRGSRVNIRIAENISSSNIIIKNCEIFYSKSAIDDNGGGIYIDTLYSKVEIRNNKIHDFSGGSKSGIGIILFKGNNDVIIENNEIYNFTIGVFYKHGVNNSTNTPIIRNNLIHDVSQHGIHVTTDNTLIENNIIYNTGWAAIRIYEVMSSCDSVGAFYTKIYHNTIVNGNSGFLLWHPSDCSDRGARYTDIKDNIIYNFTNSENRGLSNWPYGTVDNNNTTFDHNLIYSSSFSSPIRVLGNYYTTATAPLTGTGNIQQEPIFKDYANKDFTLLSNSPGYKAASDGYDMGADTSLSPTPTPDGGGGGGNTPPPSSSGDASASGGSGCGFVKEDGKGQGTKGEGVSMMILLVLALTAIVLFKKIKYFKGLLFLIMFLFPFSIANAAEYYVATNGSDSNPGTEALPWQHIAWATCSGSYGCPIATNNPNKLKAGDTLYIRGGTYLENKIQFTNSGTSTAPIIIKAYPDEKPIIDGGFTAVSNGTEIIPVFDIGAIAGQGSHYITIDGLRITRGSRVNIRIAENTASSNIKIKNCEIDSINVYDNSAGIYVDTDYSKVVISNNRIHDLISGDSKTSNGIIIFTGNNDVVIENNEIYNFGNGILYKHGVINSPNMPIVRNNIIHDVSYYGIELATNNTLIENNIIYNAGEGAIYTQEMSSDCNVSGLDHTKIYHNTIIAGGRGIWLEQPKTCDGTRYTDIKNNLIYNFINSEMQGLAVWPWATVPDTSNTTFDHNLIYSSNFTSPIRVLGNYYTTATAPLTGTGNIQQAPIFKDYANKDFTLMPNSPGYKAASDGYDMGADTSLPPTPTPDGGGGNTPPPSSGSGGDSSASGGSGCGFVKDINGKGQGAKGEGLTFAIMLIIALTGIALVRRFSCRFKCNQ